MIYILPGFNFKEFHWEIREIKNWGHIRNYKIGQRISYIVKLY